MEIWTCLERDILQLKGTGMTCFSLGTLNKLLCACIFISTHHMKPDMEISTCVMLTLKKFLDLEDFRFWIFGLGMLNLI